MGKFARKTPYKKLLKEEKAKTKLKVSHKTILPKGQNITNPTFKVRKIVVKSQLKDHAGEIVSKSNHNVNDLLSRLHHHNAPLRINSLNSLNEILNTHKEIVIRDNLPALLHAASNLVLDKEKDVRNEAIKLLSSILTYTTEFQLASLFEITIKYLACAMTHINASIRESSLAMFDVLLTKYPNLTAKHCETVILPAFLDLISTKFFDSERQLSLQYNDKMSTNVWRMKVLARLKALLNAIVNVHTEQKSDSETYHYVKRIKWTDSPFTYASLYHYSSDMRNLVELSDIQSYKSQMTSNHVIEIQAYSEILIPLLLDIFVEVAPQKIKIQRAGQHLSNEAAVLLRFTADIILSLWQIYDTSDSLRTLKAWFLQTYASSILSHLISDRFPYVLNEQLQDSHAKNKKQRKVMTVGSVPAEYSQFLSDRQCLHLNISLARIYLLFHDYWTDSRESKSVVQYVLKLLQSCKNSNRELITELLSCVDTIFSDDGSRQKRNKFDDVQFVKVIKQLYDDCSIRYDSHHNYITEKTFNYLYKMVLHNQKNLAKNDTELNNWLDSLPALLTEKRISYHRIKCISNIARCGLSSFVSSLDAYIETILDNLPRLDIVTERKLEKAEGKKLIANLLYFVQTWDQEFVSGLTAAIEKNYFSSLTDHIKDIMECKTSGI